MYVCKNINEMIFGFDRKSSLYRQIIFRKKLKLINRTAVPEKIARDAKLSFRNYPSDSSSNSVMNAKRISLKNKF